ncbi:MAG: TerB family tellurite resistance protein [Pseudomonadota bacterium]
MFDLIKKIIGRNNSKVLTTDQDILTAHLALTVLLLEAAYADGECSAKEKEHMVATLVTNFGISRQEIDTLPADRDKYDREYVDLFHIKALLRTKAKPAKISI